MDKDLLTLWHAIPSGSIKLQELADVLRLSPKQTTRRIQKWSSEGWLTFTSGSGRGNLSMLEWLSDVEINFEEQAMKIIVEEPVELSSKYLLYDWSMDSKLRLMNKFSSKFGYIQTTNDKLIIPRRYPFLTVHPLEAADGHSANLVANVYSRLVAVDETGNVTPELAHSWDITSSKLRLYLKKDIHFHDGSLLTAEDVVDCLERLRQFPHYQNLWLPIEEIVCVTPLVIDICFPQGCSYCLHMLGTMNASIYKETEGEVVGTGCFYVEDNNELKTTLVAFKEYFGERPLLDTVEFVQVPPGFDMIYRSSANENDDSTFQVESDSGFGIIIMNTFRNSAIRRKEVRTYLHHVIARHRHEIVTADRNVIPNNRGCLVESEMYTVREVKRPDITEPLIIKVVNYTEQMTLRLKKVLDNEGIPAELKWVAFEDMIHKTDDNQNVDLFIHGEIFEMNQNFSFFYFLQNGYSPFGRIVESDNRLSGYLAEYAHSPFKNWSSLNLKVEKALIDESIIIPLYYAKRHIPFSADLMNITIKHFGYVDFSKLWIRPNID